MHISRRMIVFDAADLHAESAFWAGLLGGTVQAGDRWHSIWVDGTWQLGVQLVPDHVPPEWPDGTPQQVHFDLYFDDVRDLDAAHEEVIGLGGRLLKETADRSQVSGAQVYADPAGHPFCLCWLPPQVGDRVKLTYPDGSEVEGVWAEETDNDSRPVPVLRLDDGTVHRDVAGHGRRRVVREKND
jgi:predicted enzyme related to lactoylglutathione lyase